MKSLHELLNDYLAVRRALGFKLERENRIISEFLTYLESKGSDFITVQLALDWATQSNASKSKAARRLSMVRLFAQYVCARDCRTEIPPSDLLPNRPTRLVPYLYSEKEVQRLMTAARRFSGLLKPYTYETLIGLLATTGMRVGEAIRLDFSDFDDREGLLVIRKSKFGKSREVMLHPTTVKALRAYLRKRNEIFPRLKHPAFFVSNTGNRLIYKNVHHGFLKMLSWEKLSDRKPHRPRIHDLRHWFTIQTLINWYQANENIEPKLPLLSTYLGHVSPSSTYWYLTATPELVSFAAQRLEKAMEVLP